METNVRVVILNASQVGWYGKSGCGVLGGGTRIDDNEKNEMWVHTFLDIGKGQIEVAGETIDAWCHPGARYNHPKQVTYHISPDGDFQLNSREARRMALYSDRTSERVDASGMT